MTPSVADNTQTQGAQLPNFQIPSPSFTFHVQPQFHPQSTDSNTTNGFNHSNFVFCSNNPRRKLNKVKKLMRTKPLFPVPATSVSVNNSFNTHSIDSFATINSYTDDLVTAPSVGGDFGRLGSTSSDTVGTAGLSVPADLGKFENIGFVFGASKDGSSLNVKANNLQNNNESVERDLNEANKSVTNNNDNVESVVSNFDFAVGENDMPKASEFRANVFGKFSVGCGFGDIKRDNVVDLDAKNRDGVINGCGFGDGHLVFGSSESNVVLNSVKERGVSGVGDPCKNVETCVDEKEAEDNRRAENRKFNNSDFIFSASRTDSRSDANLKKKGIKGNGGGSVKVRGTENSESEISADDVGSMFLKESNSSEGENSKYTETLGKFSCFEFGVTPDESPSDNMEEKQLGTGLGNLGFAEGKQSVNIQTKFQGEVDINIGSNLKNEFGFVFGSMNGLGSNCMSTSNISAEMQTLNLNDHVKVSDVDNFKDSNINKGDSNNFWDVLSISTKGLQNEGFNNAHAFGTNENIQEFKKTEVASMGHSLGNNGNADASVRVEVQHEELKAFGVTEKVNRPLNLNENSMDGGQTPRYQPKTDNELKFDSFSSSLSSSDLPFVTKVRLSEEPLTNKVEMANNCSFTSFPVDFGASFTGFSTPNSNLSHSFTGNLIPELNTKLEFSLNISVGDKGLKKTRRKLKQKNLVHKQAAQANALKEGEIQHNQESPGYCSPMDFSPYQDTNCELSSTKSTELTEERNEESIDGESKNSMAENFEFSATPFSQGEVSPTKPRHQKKYKLKIGRGVNCITSARKVSIPDEQSTGGKFSHADGKHFRLEPKDATQDPCQEWRTRGNQAYKDGDLQKAETYYTKGVQSIPENNTSGFCSESLVLCYSNRAATRMSLGRVREALEDCKMAASLDPTFIKVHLRAANCHLVLGEVEEAICNYNKCLETKVMICLDRRFTIEAADGLQKAQKVADCESQSAELLQLKTFDSADKALGLIAEALAISCYSEKLLELKGEALLLLRKHGDVIQLCEQTLTFAEKNFTMKNENGFDNCNSPKLWRWDLLSRSYFSLGRLDRALDLIEKQVELRHGGSNHESSNILAVTIRELLHYKKAGNEAFQSGRHTEAIEHYTTAILKSVESRPFSAVCICNRAAARQALGELIDAIADCSLAIALDGNYSKALSRRATLHEMIRDYNASAIDLRRFISILEKQSVEKSQLSGTPDKSTGSSVKDLRRARRRLSALEEKGKKRVSLDLYLILGIKASDSSSEVKKAYRKAALRHHPDKAGQFLKRSECGGDEQQWKEILETIHMDADRLFKMIGEANAVLSDSTKRTKYDIEEEMRREDEEDKNLGRSCNYRSPFENSNRRRSQEEEWGKAYGNSYSRHWQESWKAYSNSSTRW